MKLAICAILLVHTLSFKMKAQKGFYYSYSDPVYYQSGATANYVPQTSYGLYDPYATSFYNSAYTQYPTVPYGMQNSYGYNSPFGFRRAGQPVPNKEEIKNEISQLKKEVWGKDNYSTEDIRKDNKAYDAKWLITQLKITRVLELEDLLNEKGPSQQNQEEKPKEDKESQQRKNKVEDKTNSKVEISKDTKTEGKNMRVTSDEDKKGNQPKTKKSGSPNSQPEPETPQSGSPKSQPEPDTPKNERKKSQSQKVGEQHSDDKSGQTNLKQIPSKTEKAPKENEKGPKN